MRHVKHLIGFIAISYILLGGIMFIITNNIMFHNIFNGGLILFIPYKALELIEEHI